MSFSVVASQFNQWDHSWHTFATHRDRNLYGKGVTDEELRYLESAFPQDRIHHLDVEGWRTDIYASRGWKNGIVFHAKIPFIRIGAPNWDSVAEEAHEALGVGGMQRDVYARSDTFIYLKNRNNTHIVQRGKELNRSGLGDISLGVTIPLKERWGAEQRLSLTLEAPTGKEGTLHGSGGIDAGLGWSMAWRRSNMDYRVALGYSHQSRSGSFFGYDRSDTAHVIAGLDRWLSSRTALTANSRVDMSPIGNIIGGYAGYPSIIYRLGVVRAIGRSSWMSFELSEALKPQTGVDADWGLHLMFGRKLRAGELR